MNYEEKFNEIISRDPYPGVKGRFIKSSQNKTTIPGWIIGSHEESITVSFNTLKDIYGINSQTIYDILELGLTSIEGRPVCPVCGNPIPFISIGSGYSKTCSLKCSRKLKKIERESNIQNQLNLIISGELSYFRGKVSRWEVEKFLKYIKSANEVDLFNRLVRLDPNPGSKNRAYKENGLYVYPGWISIDKSIVDPDGLIRLKLRESKLIYSRSLSTPKILHDILNLGLTSMDERPKCPICGKPSKFKTGEGYYDTCGNPTCKSKWASIREKENPPFNGVFSEEQRKHISEGVLRAIKDGKLDFSNRGRNGYKNGKVLLSSFGIEIYHDSGWELDFLNFCNDNSNLILSVKRSKLRLPYIFGGSNHFYLPDFEIELEGKRVLVEIKPENKKNTDDITKVKIQTGEDYVKSSGDFQKYLVLTEKDLYVNSKPKNGIDVKNLINILTTV